MSVSIDSSESSVGVEGETVGADADACPQIGTTVATMRPITTGMDT